VVNQMAMRDMDALTEAKGDADLLFAKLAGDECAVSPKIWARCPK
jgi:hypothetical protein